MSQGRCQASIEAAFVPGRSSSSPSRQMSGYGSPTGTSGGSPRPIRDLRMERSEKGVLEVMPPDQRGHGCEKRRI